MMEIHRHNNDENTANYTAMFEDRNGNVHKLIIHYNPPKRSVINVSEEGDNWILRKMYDDPKEPFPQYVQTDRLVKFMWENRFRGK